MRTRHLVVAIVCCLLSVPPVRADEQEWTVLEEADWTVLFDGTSTDAWRGYNKGKMPDGWVIDDGTLHRKDGAGDIITKKQYGDFVLELEWKVAEGGNSGIMYRVSEGDDAPYWSGPEYQILDNATHRDGQNKMTSAGALYGLYETDPTVAKAPGEWNYAMIVVHDSHIQHWLNGKKIVDCEIGSDDWNERLAKSKFASWEKFAKNKTGHIALQDHGDPIWFRKIRVHALSGDHGHDHEHDHDHGHDDDE